MTIYMWIATCAWCLLVAGYLSRRHRVRHVRLVSSGMLVDASLVLFLEATRGAVEKALEFSLSPLQQLHIGFSTCALLLYIPVVILGRRMLRDSSKPALRTLHRKVALTALGCRTIGFVLMFSMWK